MWEVIETSKKVAEASSHVLIDKKSIVSFSKKILHDRTTVPPWNRFYHFCGRDEDTVSYILVLDSLNFCFWPKLGAKKWEIQYDSKILSGYYAMAASLKRAIESGMQIIEPGYLIELSFDTLKKTLGGKGELQLMEKRVRILNELGRMLIREFDGKACKLVEEAKGSAIHLTRLLADKLLSFNDVAHYRDYEVFFYKRAQIVAADLYGALEGKNWGNFVDIDKLTAFADYKLPQVLRQQGILRYKPSLSRMVDGKILICHGSAEEVEIRANTVWAVELIKQELHRMGKNLRAFEVDWLLWNLGQGKDFRKNPYHRTVTIFY